MIEETDFRQVATAWAEHKSRYVKRSTICNYELTLRNHLLPAFGASRDVTEEAVQRFVMEKLRAGLSHKSVHDMVVVLKMVSRFGAKHFGIKSPDWEIRFPTPRTGAELPVLSLRHHRRLLEYVKRNLTSRNLGILICLHTGIRIGEVCSLTWGDIDTAAGVISINKTIGRVYVVEEEGGGHTELSVTSPKTRNSYREIPMTRDLLQVLRPLKGKAFASDYVVTNRAKPTEPRTYRAYFSRLLTKLNIPHLRFHGLRHTFATRCIEGKADYKTVSVLLGHSKISTTLDLYVHPGNDQKKRCIDRMMKRLDNS